MSKRKTPSAGRAKKKPINPAALSPAELAALLSKAGDRAVTAAEISAAVAAGAPANAGGTLHVVHFTAWLAGQSRGSDGRR